MVDMTLSTSVGASATSNMEVGTTTTSNMEVEGLKEGAATSIPPLEEQKRVVKQAKTTLLVAGDTW